MRTVGLIRVDMVFDTAGGVTAPEVESAHDLPLRRDRDGLVWLPPTSLAGSLRAHFGARAPQFFGSPAPLGKGTDPLTPSPVRVLGTATAMPDGAKPEVRRSTAIDTRRGAAVVSTLRSRELLPAGTTVALFLRYDRRQDALADYDLDGFVDTVRTWRPCIGRGRSTGHGRARVTRVAARSLDLRRPDQLLAWLRSGRDELFPPGDEGWDRVVGASSAPVDALLEVGFESRDALHVGSGRAGGVNGIATSDGRPLIAGSAWKGLLRSRCGYILRSCGVDACLVPAPDERACGSCVLCEVFGWTGDGGEVGQTIGCAGWLTFHDSQVDGTVGRRQHIGIDRVTGGVRTGLLFTDDVVTGGRFTLSISADRPLSPEIRGLLLLAMRDLDAGLTGIGRSTTRGYGTVRLTDTSRATLAELDPTHPTGAAVRSLLTGSPE